MIINQGELQGVVLTVREGSFTYEGRRYQANYGEGLATLKKLSHSLKSSQNSNDLNYFSVKSNNKDDHASFLIGDTIITFAFEKYKYAVNNQGLIDISSGGAYSVRLHNSDIVFLYNKQGDIYKVSKGDDIIIEQSSLTEFNSLVRDDNPFYKYVTGYVGKVETFELNSHVIDIYENGAVNIDNSHNLYEIIAYTESIIEHKTSIKELQHRFLRPSVMTYYGLDMFKGHTGLISSYFHGLEIDPSIYFEIEPKIGDSFQSVVIAGKDGTPFKGMKINNSFQLQATEFGSNDGFDFKGFMRLLYNELVDQAKYKNQPTKLSLIGGGEITLWDGVFFEDRDNSNCYPTGNKGTKVSANIWE